ncbi:MAG: glycosyltransferase family 2 protein [Bacteroidetes bacterium]|nr:glycosyltransferase family 2 protein [Bacteroidota bacterium]MCL5027189.1 glycosyltransferase family 2 protein [Chloroflexota bacterium]
MIGIVIPAYNEERRLPDTLSQVAGYLGKQQYSWSIIVVDDGSTDHTAEVVEAFVRQHPNVRLVRNPHCGKAYAVRTGMLASEAKYVFLCDADLPMPISELEKLLPPLQEGYRVAIGSREVAGASRLDEPWHRHLMGRIFNLLVQLVAVGGFQDTQCGFKGFHRDAAQDLFRRLKLYASPDNIVKGPMVTGFDVEVLFLAKKMGYSTAEVPVLWHYVPGSKVSPLKDSVRMLMDVLRVRYNDLRGRYD